MSGSARFLGNSGHAHGNPPGAGVLLVNLGTPEAPTPRAVRRFLAEFLGDARVIEIAPWLRWLLLQGVVLRVRPRRSALAYAKIWTAAGSPLLVNSMALARKLASALAAARPAPIRVALAMRYGRPSIAQTLEELDQHGVRRLLVLPLYPQYSATSTGSVFDAVTASLQRRRWPPELRFINGYHDQPEYVAALAQSVDTYRKEHGASETLLLSFHGIPERYFRAGDPYFCQCQATARLLRERLGLEASAVLVSFQSRVGREPWLQPYTDQVLARLARQGVRHVQVLCPGFAVDCLETLEEVALNYRARFIAAGGQRLDYIPALNSSTAHVDMLERLVLRHAQGWPEFASDWSEQSARARADAARQRFEDMRDAGA